MFFRRYRRIIIFLAVVVVFFWLIWLLRIVLLPFALGLIFAYLVYPIILWVERKLPARQRWQGPRRAGYILLVYLIIIAILGIVGYVTVPMIIDSAGKFFANLPNLIPDAVKRIQDWTESIRDNVPPEMRDQVDAYVTDILSNLAKALERWAMSVLAALASQIGLILGFAALPVFVFYILKDAESISAAFYSSLSAWSAEQAKHIMGIINDVLGRYIRTQIVLGIIVGVMALVGLLILRIPYAPALAFWAGLTELVPLFGPWIGGITGALVTLATVPDKIIWVIIMYVAVQVTENSLLVPRIAGEFLQVHPALILVLIVVGGHFFGIWGIILVVPVTATLIRLYRYILRATKKEELRESIDHPPEPT